MKRYQRGLTLIELLIAACLGLLLLALAMRIYLSVKANIDDQQALMRIQQTATIAAHLIRHDLMNVGYGGCFRLTPWERFHIGVNTQIPAPLKSRISARTSVLNIHSTRAGVWRMITDGQSSMNIPLYWAGSIRRLIVTDCRHGELKHVCYSNHDGHHHSVHFCHPLSHFHAPIKVLPIKHIVYFVTSEHRRHGQSIKTLHRKDLSRDLHIPDAVINRVSRLAVRFVILTDHGLVYQRHASVNGHEALQGIQVNLLIDSGHAVYWHPHEYQFLGQNHQAHDLKMHRQWSFYVALRNAP